MMKNKLKYTLTLITMVSASSMLVGCAGSGGMFNHTNDYKKCEERPVLCLPKNVHAQALSEEYAIPELNRKGKTTVAVTSTPTEPSAAASTASTASAPSALVTSTASTASTPSEATASLQGEKSITSGNSLQ
jgi:uncharacterized lipoprotein